MAFEMEKAYDPKKVESEIYSRWEKSGYSNPDKLPQAAKESFTIMMAPPNVTGSLHIGHALENTISDILIRWKRMRGFKTLWLPGTDHAGIATQNAVEKEIRKQGTSRHELGREKFLDKVWEWKEKYGDIILDQLKKLGVSADWSRTRFTMDADYKKAVEAAFLHYYKKGYVYRGKRTINWCYKCSTSLSDLEIEYREENGKFYYIKYGPIIIGTVRPETKLGDTALAVNPKDKRYKNFIEKEITIESVDPSIPLERPPQKKEINIKVIADEAADPKFGSGVIKVTPAHDITDFEIYQRHPEIPIKKVIGENGRMSSEAGIRYEGLKVKEAREQIVKDMNELGLIEKIEDYTHNIATCYRCNSVIEPLLSDQWFLKMKELSRLAIGAVKSKRVKILPKKFEKPYLNWLENIKDWCISRQLWWGHQIPAWYCACKEEKQKIVVGEKPPRDLCEVCRAPWERFSDVLDTWFSSALWPFATLGWPEKTSDLSTFYPTSIITSARDIINLWDGRMIFSGIEFMKKEPFKDLFIHATILTKDGKRMSKSLGTGIDPLELIERYGADATRFGLIWQAMGTQDIHWDESAVVAGKKFANKIWNASRFVLGKLPDGTKFKIPELSSMAMAKRDTDKESKVILKKTIKTKEKVDKHLAKYEFGHALHELYDFFWHSYCDVYLEETKKMEGNNLVLVGVLAESLKMLHPFMPFITEEIYQKLPLENKKLLLVEHA